MISLETNIRHSVKVPGVPTWPSPVCPRRWVWGCPCRGRTVAGARSPPVGRSSTHPGNWQHTGQCAGSMLHCRHGVWLIVSYKIESWTIGISIILWRTFWTAAFCPSDLSNSPSLRPHENSSRPTTNIELLNTEVTFLERNLRKNIFKYFYSVTLKSNFDIFKWKPSKKKVKMFDLTFHLDLFQPLLHMLCPMAESV